MPNSSARIIAALLLITTCSPALAQDVRYSWFEMSFVGQDVDRQGVLADLALGQSVDVSGSDGNGIRFRGSVGTWKNLFAFVDYSSSDIDVDAVVSNAQGQFPAGDEFDFTTVRAGVGLKWSLRPKTDIYGALSFDSTDFDFGSFAGESFDTDDQGLGFTLGIRSIFRDKIEFRAHARQTGVGDVDLSSGELDSDTLFGVGFGFELIRGLSITGDFESGEFSNWNIGFRLDLDED